MSLDQMQYVTVFKEIMERPEFRGYRGADMAKWSGLSESQISRFLNGKSDIPVSKFFKLVQSMPAAFRQSYWRELLEPGEPIQGWTSAISQASHSEIEEILSALATRWSELNTVQEDRALVL